MPLTFMPRHSSLLILSPDALFSGAASEIVKRLALAGWSFNGAASGILSISDVANLYQVNRNERGCSQADSLVDRLFAAGTSFWCMVSRPAGTHEDNVFNALKAIKGPSDPLLCEPHQFRRCLGATNPIMNLLHTSDSIADAQWERRVMNMVRTRVDVELAAHSVDSIFAALSPGEPRSPSGYKASHALKVLACAHPKLRGMSRLRRLLDEEAELLMSTDHVQHRKELTSLARDQCALVESERIELCGLEGAFFLSRDLLTPNWSHPIESLPQRLSMVVNALLHRLDRCLDDWLLLVLHCEIEGIRMRERHQRLSPHTMAARLSEPAVPATRTGH